MFHKDTFRLIKSTFNRFFSLFMIVLIGVAFMMGLLSTRPIMERSVDKYFDTNELQDFQLYSSYGFDENDVKEIKKLEYIEKCLPSRMVDVFCRNEDGDVFVTRVEELNRNMNKFELVSGRLPQKDDELVLVLNTMNKDFSSLDQKLEFYLEDSDIHDNLVNDTYTIVGIAKTPGYMSKAQGTSTLKNLELELIVYVPNSNFISEYYTTVYLKAAEAAEYDSYSKQYEKYIEGIKADLEVFANRQQDALKTRLLDEYKAKISEGEEELRIKKEDAQKQLDEAKSKLDDARIQIIAGETQMETMRTALATAENRVKALQRTYDAENADVNKKMADIVAKDGRNRSFETIMAEATTDYATYNGLKRIVAAGNESQYSENIARIEQENREKRALLENELYPERDRLTNIINSAESSETEKESASAALVEINSQIIRTENDIQVNELLIENLKEFDGQNVSDAQAMMDEIDSRYNGSIETTYISYLSVAEEQIRMQTTAEEIRIANEAISRVNNEISAGQREIEKGRSEYAVGEKQYQEALIQFNDEIEKAEAEIRKAYQDLEELPDAKWIILDRESHYSSYMFANNAKQMGAIGTSLPILFYLVAALVCMTTMTRLVDEQRGQIGIFRALGFSNNQIISKYIIYALAASLSGSILGIFLGMAIFPTVIYQTWRLMYDLPDMVMMFPISNILISIFAFSTLMAVVTYFVVRKTLKETPSQLLRPKAPKNAKKVFLEKISFLWNRLSFTSKITARNLIRYKSRFFMTVIGVAGCTGLLVVGWGIKDSISDVVAIQFGDIYNYNYVVNLENDHNITEMMDILENDLTNEYVSPMMSYSSKAYLDNGEKVITVDVMDARKGNDVYNLRLKDHKTPIKINNSGVIISEKYAENNNIKAGDYITIESKNGIKAQVKVNDICEMYFQHYIFMSEEYYNAIFNEPVHYNNIAVKTSDGVNLEKSIKDIEGFESLVDFTNVVDQFNTMIKALDFIIRVIILTAGSLAFVVLINLTQVNISERIREIATLKVLGFRNHEINSYLFKEILLLSVIGGLFGLPLGVVEHHFIMGVIDMEMIKFSYNIKPLSFLLAYAITIVFTLIVLFFTRKPLRKIKMIESLKSVE